MSTAEKIQRDERVSKLARLIGRVLRTARARAIDDTEDLLAIRDLDVIQTGRYGLGIEWRGRRYLVTVQELSAPYRPEAGDEL